MIYLVDDDPIQNMLTSQLVGMNIPDEEYQIFNNGEEVLNAIEAGGKPSIILLDINMPIMDGWQFLDAYISHEQNTSVFMLSSSTNASDTTKAKEYTCVKGYYTKPIDENTILEIWTNHTK